MNNISAWETNYPTTENKITEEQTDDDKTLNESISRCWEEVYFIKDKLSENDVKLNHCREQIDEIKRMTNEISDQFDSFSKGLSERNKFYKETDQYQNDTRREIEILSKQINDLKVSKRKVNH